MQTPFLIFFILVLFLTNTVNFGIGFAVYKGPVSGPVYKVCLNIKLRLEIFIVLGNKSGVLHRSIL